MIGWLMRGFFYFGFLIVIEVLLLLAYDIAFSYIERERVAVESALRTATVQVSIKGEEGGPNADARGTSLRRRLGARLPLEKNSVWPVGMRERVRGTVTDAIRLDWEDRVSSKCPAFATDINHVNGTGLAVGYGLSFGDVALMLPLSPNSPATDRRVNVWLRYVGEFFGPENVFLSTTVVEKPTASKKDVFDYPVVDNRTWEVNGVTFPKLEMPTFDKETDDYKKRHYKQRFNKNLRVHWQPRSDTCRNQS